jgi:hypothetical protein
VALSPFPSWTTCDGALDCDAAAPARARPCAAPAARPAAPRPAPRPAPRRDPDGAARRRAWRGVTLGGSAG